MVPPGPYQTATGLGWALTWFQPGCDDVSAGEGRQDGQHSTVVSRSLRELRGWDSPVRRTEVTEAARRSLLGCRSSLPAPMSGLPLFSYVRAGCLVSVRVSFAVSGAAANSLPTSSYLRLYECLSAQQALDYRLERTPTDRLNCPLAQAPSPDLKKDSPTATSPTRCGSGAPFQLLLLATTGFSICIDQTILHFRTT